jgi:hypothetical protein
MKSLPLNLSLALLMFFIICSMKPDPKSKFVGTFHLEKATTNGQPNPPIQMDRTVTFFENNQFSSDIRYPGGQNFPFNQGVYIVQNDSILVLHHTERDIFLDVAWVYRYKFVGDTLCYKGFYTMPVPQSPKVLVKFYVDEKWVRIN